MAATIEKSVRVEKPEDGHICPVAFIALYGSERHRNKAINYAEISHAKRVKNGFDADVWKPLRYEDMAALMSSAESPDYTAGLHGMMPNSVVYYKNKPGQMHFAFRTPPQCRRLLYSDADVGDLRAKADNHRKERTDYYYLPEMIWLVEGRQLRVALILKGKVLIEYDNKIFMPFPNFFGDNQLCFGSAKRPRIRAMEFVDAIQQVTDVIYGNNFTHAWTDTQAEFWRLFRARKWKSLDKATQAKRIEGIERKIARYAKKNDIEFINLQTFITNERGNESEDFYDEEEDFYTN